LQAYPDVRIQECADALSKMVCAARTSQLPAQRKPNDQARKSNGPARKPNDVARKSNGLLRKSNGPLAQIKRPMMQTKVGQIVHGLHCACDLYTRPRQTGGSR
jgi:hypothetical protein